MLYQEVWDEPMTKVAQRYNVSDVALKKTCKKLNIPVPGRGYWSKVRAGEKMTKPPLPQHVDNKRIIIREPANQSARNYTAMKKADVLLFLHEDKREEVKAFCASIVVPNELKQPHVFVRDTIQYHKSRKDSTKPPKNHVFNTSVCNEQQDRAYRIWDAIFKAVEKLGYTVKIESPRGQRYWNYDPPTASNVIYIQLEQDRVPVYIKEHQKRVEHVITEKELAEKKKYGYAYIPNYDFLYSGKLSFTIDEYHAKRKSWNDGKKKSIDDEIGDIVIGIMEAIHIVKENREKREIREQKRLEEEIRRWEMEKRRDKEKERIKFLIAEAEDYYQARKLYEYIAALNAALPNFEDDEQKELKQYLSWAKQKADWLNPLKAKEDEVMGKRHERIVVDLGEEEDDY